MSDYYAEWTKDVKERKDDRIFAIERYCGWISMDINSFLRGKTQSISELNASIINTLDTMFKSSPCFRDNIVLYRSLPLFVIEKILAEMKTYGFFQEKGFLSTSICFRGISFFQSETVGAESKWVLKLYAGKGIPAMYVGDVKGEGMEEREEYEVILPRNSKIVIFNGPYKEKTHGFWMFEGFLEY